MRVHGLLKPRTVKLGDKRLEERQRSECGNGCAGWTWDENHGITTIRRVDPIPIQEKTTLALEGAGTPL
ncbi:MAG: hypothetical protein DMG26_07135 [Acidobacteria bacterium]|nr:MAG: hypothetical protein DMG26_07135 [Acidobacteriota bacterium]